MIAVTHSVFLLTLNRYNTFFSSGFIVKIEYVNAGWVTLRLRNIKYFLKTWPSF